MVAACGGYGGPKALQGAEIVYYDAIAAICDCSTERRSCTHDRMVQAARMGKNIVEGSAAIAVSSKTELKLVGVARASLEELFADDRDFLRQRSLPQWGKDDPQPLQIRKFADTPDRSDPTDRLYFEESTSGVVANAPIRLVTRATDPSDHLLKRLTARFVETGGISERILQVRLGHREPQLSWVP